MQNIDEAELLIPYALDDLDEYKPVVPLKAIRKKTYICPRCFDRVFSRQGDVNRWHFYHTGTTYCSGESIEHLTAKLWVYEAISGERDPIRVGYTRSCIQCSGNHSHSFDLSPKLGEARMEHNFRSASASNRRADIAVLDHKETEKFLIEIKATNPLSEDKIGDIGLTPWMEIPAKLILQNKAFAQNTGNFKPFEKCPNGNKKTPTMIRRKRLPFVTWYRDHTGELSDRAYKLISKWGLQLNHDGFYQNLETPWLFEKFSPNGKLFVDLSRTASRNYRKPLIYRIEKNESGKAYNSINQKDKELLALQRRLKELRIDADIATKTHIGVH